MSEFSASVELQPRDAPAIAPERNDAKAYNETYDDQTCGCSIEVAPAIRFVVQDMNLRRVLVRHSFLLLSMIDSFSFHYHLNFHNRSIEVSLNIVTFSRRHRMSISADRCEKRLQLFTYRVNDNVVL